MKCIDVMTYSLTVIASSFEAYGAYKTIRIKSEPPLKIKESTLVRDLNNTYLNRLGSEELSQREISETIQDDKNRIIREYNKSVEGIIQDNDRKDKLVALYFKYILTGFIIQIISVVFQSLYT